MKKKKITELIKPRETSSQTRTLKNRFYNAEMKLDGFYLVYISKLRDINGSGPCFIVKEDSVIMNRLKVGLGLELKCWSNEYSSMKAYYRAKVKHITKQDSGPFKKHSIVGLSIEKKKISNINVTDEKLIINHKELQHETRNHSTAGWQRYPKTCYPSKRRSINERRSGLDRRNGLDRRKIINFTHR
ncbi:MAG: hypothetical protein PVH56_03555 [Desulfobacterales bacterium]|jgi:hypothetical protein